MFLLEWVGALRLVVKGHPRPSVGDVAVITGEVDLTLVEVLVAVTTARVDGLKVPLLMTGLTAQELVLTGEGEAATAVVKEGDRPADRVLMALATVCPFKLPLVDPLGVTERALWFRVILELCAVRVTAIAGLLLMSSIQRKAGDRVIEVGLLPARGRVALRAGLALEGVPVRVI